MKNTYSMSANVQWAALGSHAITQELWATARAAAPMQRRIVRVDNVEDIRAYQQKDIDLVATYWNPVTNIERKETIEIKADRYPSGDILTKRDQGNFFLEFISNDTKSPRTPGCFVYCEADYLHYLFLATGTLYIFDCQALQACILGRLGYDPVRFLQDPRPLDDITIPGWKYTATSGHHGQSLYRTWGVAIPIAQVLQWASEDGVRVKKHHMLDQVYRSAQAMGLVDKYIKMVPASLRAHLVSPGYKL